jgi:hypothetical protein
MLAFVAAKRRFVVHLRNDDVLDELSDGPALADARSVADALAQLVEWGNLRADPDTSRATSVEDFHRARFLYQLTHAGEAAERSLAVFDEQLGRHGALQAVALEDIATGLRALHELTRDPRSGRRTDRTAAARSVRRCADLADNAQAFMGSLQRTIHLYELNAEAFRAHKDRLIEYLERFIRDLTGTRRRDRGAARPARPERWLGLQQWFISTPEHPSQAKLLRARARKAIPDLLAVVVMLNERRGGTTPTRALSSGRAADPRRRKQRQWHLDLKRLGRIGQMRLDAARASVSSPTRAARRPRPAVRRSVRAARRGRGRRRRG